MVPEIYGGRYDAESPPRRAAAPGAAWRVRMEGPLAGRLPHVDREAEALARRYPPGTRLLWDEPSPAGISTFLGALCAGLTVVPLPPGLDPEREAPWFDAAARLDGHGRLTHVPSAGALPLTPDARLLLRTSATSGAGGWVALSDDNLFAVLDSHLPRLGLEGRRVLSVLPWSHAFGLVLDLLATLLGGGCLLREPDAARDPSRLARALDEDGATRLNAVPLTLERLRRSPWCDALARLEGGIVGGAPVSAALAVYLAGSGLRVGYGLTEASPGVTLGEPGEWRAGFLGRPVGCEVRADAQGVLQFRGPNACLGRWDGGGLEPLPGDRWVWTGDYARAEGGAWVFEGRATPVFKLANGRAVDAGVVERALRRVPGVTEALCWSEDGETLVVGVSPPDTLASVDALRAALPGVGTLPLRLVGVPEEAWCRTPKGEVDRKRPPASAG